jgi:hypothetical protein
MLRRLKLSIYEVVAPREEEEICLALSYFSVLLPKRRDFRNKSIENKTWVFRTLYTVPPSAQPEGAPKPGDRDQLIRVFSTTL